MDKIKTELTSSQKAALVFMIIGCVFQPFYGSIGFIGLIWCIPMTIFYNFQQRKGKDVSTAFKICTLLFVNLIAGIIMLTSAKEKQKTQEDQASTKPLIENDPFSETDNTDKDETRKG